MDASLKGPRVQEVMAEIRSRGIRYTDGFTLSGADLQGMFLTILCHEGAGVMVETGEGVTSVRRSHRSARLVSGAARRHGFCGGQDPGRDDYPIPV